MCGFPDRRVARPRGPDENQRPDSLRRKITPLVVSYRRLYGALIDSAVRRLGGCCQRNPVTPSWHRYDFLMPYATSKICLGEAVG